MRATYINQARVHMGYHYPRSYSTAINLFNSLVNLLVLFLANQLSRRISDTSLW